MSPVLVDTDVLIDLLRGHPKAREFLLHISERDAVCCSVVAVAELYAGVRDPEEQATAELVAGMIVIPITREIAEKAGRIKRDAKGHSLELDACLIAATAMVEATTLATRNARLYPFDGLELIVPDYS